MRILADVTQFEGVGFEFEADFEQTDPTVVVGKNGIGKTRIARAILWALGSEHPAIGAGEPGDLVKLTIERESSKSELLTQGGEKGRVYQRNGQPYTIGYDARVMSLIFMPELFFAMGTNEIREALSVGLQSKKIPDLTKPTRR